MSSINHDKDIYKCSPLQLNNNVVESTSFILLERVVMCDYLALVQITENPKS